MATIRELKSQASELKIRGYGKMNKAALLSAIQRHLFEEEQAEKEIDEQLEALAHTNTTQEPPVPTSTDTVTEDFDYLEYFTAKLPATHVESVLDLRDIPFMVYQGWVWYLTYLWIHRQDIAEGGREIASSASQVVLAAVVAVYFAGRTWGLLMDDLSDYIAGHSYLDMLSDLGHWTFRKLGIEFEASYRHGYAALHTKRHQYRVITKPRWSFEHYSY